jgi:hypothetical protein
VITSAKILQHVGAVRAMEFDINPEWHTLITYTHDANGLVPTMQVNGLPELHVGRSKPALMDTHGPLHGAG